MNPSKIRIILVTTPCQYVSFLIESCGRALLGGGSNVFREISVSVVVQSVMVVSILPVLLYYIIFS